jgi:hypothetical protein
MSDLKVRPPVPFDGLKKETTEKLQSSIARIQLQGFLLIGAAKRPGLKTCHYEKGEPRRFLRQGKLEWMCQ